MTYSKAAFTQTKKSPKAESSKATFVNKHGNLPRLFTHKRAFWHHIWAFNLREFTGFYKKTWLNCDFLLFCHLQHTWTRPFADGGKEASASSMTATVAAKRKLISSIVSFNHVSPIGMPNKLWFPYYATFQLNSLAFHGLKYSIMQKSPLSRPSIWQNVINRYY